MAIKFSSVNNGLARITGSFLNPAGDFTLMYWVQFTAPYNGNFRTASVLGDDTYALGYVWIGNDNGQPTDALKDNLQLETQNDVPTTSFTSGATQIPTIWAHFAITYDSTTHIASLYMNGSLFASATAINLSAVTFAAERLGFDSIGVDSNIAFAYYRSFASKLTATEIKAEMRSATAVKASPFCDTPLTGPTDLADVSGNNRDWTLVGAGTDYTGPVLLTTITNIDANNAQDLGSNLPITYVQNVRDSTTHDVWFKYTAMVTDTVVGFSNFGALSGYVPTTVVYDSLANALLDVPYIVFVNASNFNAPIQVPVFSGNTYYFKIISHNGTGSNPAVLIASLLKAPDLIVPIGSIAIPDDIDGEFGLPLALLDSTTGQVLKFINNFPVANNSEILPSGKLLIGGSIDATDPNEYLFMYDINLVLIHSKIAVPPLTNNGFLISSDRNGTFYVAQAISNTVAKVTTIDASTGLQGPTVWSIPITSFTLHGIAISLDNTILYYTIGTVSDSAIHRWDLVNNIALSDLVAAPSGYITRPNISGGSCDILVLQNGNIVVPFTKTRIDNLIKVYSSVGATINTVAINQELDRLTHAIDDPNSYWAWIQQTMLIGGTPTQNGFSEYRNIKASDGSTIFTTGVFIPNYEFAKYAPGEDSNVIPEVVIAPLARFGASQSCPMWITRAVISPSGGIYKLVINKRNDTLYITGDVKIPDPFFKTGLIGG